jgi:PKHD-type hydroxylase
VTADINEIICYPGIVAPAMCDRIAELGDALELESGNLVGDQRVNARERRLSDVGFFLGEESYQFIFDGVAYFTNKANSEAWRFELQGILPLQYSVYREGHFIEWHHDTLSAPPDPSRSGPPPVRKLSFSLQLSDPDTYEGGDFQIRGEDGHVDEALWRTMRQKGSFLIFPGVIPHRVTSVTAGERRSLVGWVLGPPSELDTRFTIEDGEGIV